MQKIAQQQLVLGIIEPVSFPALGVYDVLAKIDTGAYSGALHCESIEVVRHPVTGKRALEIVPVDATSSPVLIEKYARVSARSSTGHRSDRYIIETPITIQGKEYRIKIGVTKRDEMNLKVLVGRRFLRQNNMLVDVTLNAELDNDGGRK